MFGIGLLLYPQAADWFSSLSHRSQIATYMGQVESAESGDRQRILDVAHDYNEQLNVGPLTDPYVSEFEDSMSTSDRYRAFEKLMNVSGADAIGTLSYPGVDISLPIFHGTSGRVLSTGVGHLYGTSLPVGGPGTRSVLTAHSGLVRAKLFSSLHDARVGDIFWISVLGEDHHYRVEQIHIVRPDDTESLTIIEGEDWVTLFTCTPIRVNSHRLLVHAQRTDPPGDAIEVAAADAAAHAPWWAVMFVGGSLLAALILFLPMRTKKAGPDSDRSRGTAGS